MSHKYWATCLYTFLSERVGDLSGTSLVKETTKNDHRAFLILVGPPSSMLKWGLLVVPLFVPLTRENWENRSPDREKNGEKEEKMSTCEVYIPDILPCRPRAREKWSHYLNDEHAHLYLSTQFSAGENSPPLALFTRFLSRWMPDSVRFHIFQAGKESGESYFRAGGKLFSYIWRAGCMCE